MTLSATGGPAAGWRHYLGSYEDTGEEPPVYSNSGGRLLYRNSYGTWRFDYGPGVPGNIRSVDTASPCPADVQKWERYYNDEWVYVASDDIRVRCSAHT